MYINDKNRNDIYYWICEHKGEKDTKCTERAVKICVEKMVALIEKECKKLQKDEKYKVDPTAVEIREDVKRLCDLLAIQASTSALEAGYLAFPTSTDWTLGLLKEVTASVTGNVRIVPLSEYHVTCEGPEDGLPAYFSNVARFTRLERPATVEHGLRPTAPCEIV